MKKAILVSSIEELMEDGSVVEVACPYCQEGRSVEPDANYVVDCEGCGEKYKVQPVECCF